MMHSSHLLLWNKPWHITSLLDLVLAAGFREAEILSFLIVHHENNDIIETFCFVFQVESDSAIHKTKSESKATAAVCIRLYSCSLILMSMYKNFYCMLERDRNTNLYLIPPFWFVAIKTALASW